MAKENLQDIFSKLRDLLKQYTPPLVSKINTETRYDLWSVKDVVIAGRKRKDVYFAGLIIQKGYVGFYFMPVYTTPEMKEVFKPELLKLLKGKSCFYIKKLEPQILNQVSEALKTGFEMYKKNGWV